MSDSDDDQPLVARRVASAPAAKQEQGAAAKPAAVKAEVKPEVKAEDAAGPKGPHQADAKGKGQDKKPPAARGKASAKDEVAAPNGKTAAGTPKTVKEEVKQPREKKEYDMPGQTRDPPPETDALRKFYTSLLEQRPDSEMAKKWCLTHGLLSHEMAEELVAQLKKAKPVVKSPAKPSGRPDGKSAVTKTRRPVEKVPAAKRQRQAVSPPKKTRAKYSDEEDDASSSESDDDDDDDEPIGRAKPAAKAAPKGEAAAASKPAAAKRKPLKGKQDNAFTDGGLDSDDDSDDLPLVQRSRK